MSRDSQPSNVIPLPTPPPVERPLRAVIYLRVSTVEQAATDYDDDGYSLQAQRDACRRAAERLNAEVVDEYVDRGKSARSADRPELQNMLRRAASSRDVDYVIVHKVDRLARSRADDVQIVLALRKAGATLVSATENIDETPSGTLLHAIMAAVAEFYSGNLAQEARKGMKKKAELGGTPGNAPVGYLNVRDRIDGRDVGIVVPDPERADHVRWAFRAYSSGDYTLDQLARELTERGFTLRATLRYPERAVRPQQLQRILRGRYYLGLVRFAGVEYPGRHEPLVDELTFQLVQDVLTSRMLSKDKPQRHPHPLKAVLHCGRCGHRLGITKARGRNGDLYPYFHCGGRHEDTTSCDQGYIRVERVEHGVLRHLDGFRLDDSRRREVRAAVVARFEAQTAESSRQVASQQSRIVTLKRRKQKAKDAYFADAMSIEDFKEEQQLIARELTAAENIIQRNLASLSDLERGTDEALSLLANPAGFYAQAPDSVRQMLVQALFQRLWLIDDRVVGSDLTRPYAELLSVETALLGAAVVSSTSARHVTYHRQERDSASSLAELRPYLRVERPLGPLTPDTTNHRQDSLADGSNLIRLVGLSTFG